jgi:hypothetical protein
MCSPPAQGEDRTAQPEEFGGHESQHKPIHNPYAAACLCFWRFYAKQQAGDSLCGLIDAPVTKDFCQQWLGVFQNDNSPSAFGD